MTVPSDRIAIIGAGTSPLIGALVSEGYRAIVAVDISHVALDRLRANLNDAATHVAGVRADARSVRFAAPVDLWHDRATFHFLTDSADQASYARSAAAAVRPGGYLLVATFAERGPDHCSGLPVARHSLASLVSVFGADFVTVDSFEREHLTPWGTGQWFTHVVMRARARPPRSTPE